MPLHKITLALAACLAVAFGSLPAARAQTATFDFNAVPAGTSSPMALTQNGMTVTFTDDLGLPGPGKSTYDDGQYAVGSAAGLGYSSRFSGNVLSSAYGYSGQYHPLVMLFSQPVYGISLDFGTSFTPNAPTPVLLSAFDGTTLVGTQTGTPQVLASAPEGIFDFSSATPFNSVSLAAYPSFFLTVDNVHVNFSPNTVPEPSPVAVFGVGLLSLAGLVGARVRRRTRAGL